MEAGTIFSVFIDNKELKFRYIDKNSQCFFSEMVTDCVFNPNKITLNHFKSVMKTMLLPENGVFIKDKFPVPKGVIEKKNRIFALTTSGTVQFKPNGCFHEKVFKGVFTTPTPSVVNNEVSKNYFIIFK